VTGGAIRITGMAHGGAGVGRVDGKVVFVDGAVLGDVVHVETLRDKARYRRAVVSTVEVPSPHRIDPPCPVFGRCGGCDWQMGDLEAQRHWKSEIVRGQLAHVGGLGDVAVAETEAVGPGFGYRNRIDLRVSDGKAALLEAGSHRPVVIDGCPLVVAPVSELIAGLRPGPGIDRITLRGSDRTGEAVELVRRDGRWSRGQLHEVVAGVRFRISGRAFFQVNTPGAERLVRLVADHLRPEPSDVLLDGYAGGGLFAATVGRDVGAVVAVEQDRVAGADLEVNAPSARLVAAPFAGAVGRFDEATVGVVDPPRSGLGREAVDLMVASSIGRLAYVSCDPASFARDAAGLVAGGFELERVVPVDMFPQTHHVELVGGFRR
jgi:23S rRNA (uracil1939-C5)-methyltransferase